MVGVSLLVLVLFPFPDVSDVSWLSVCVLFEFKSVLFILFLFGALYLLWIVISDVFWLGFYLVIAFMFCLFV